MLVKKISNVSTSKGTLPIFIDDTWRLDSSTQTYESLVYIIPNGASPEKELENRYSEYPAPIHNYVERTLTMYIYLAYIYLNHTKLTHPFYRIGTGPNVIISSSERNIYHSFDSAYE